MSKTCTTLEKQFLKCVCFCFPFHVNKDAHTQVTKTMLFSVLKSACLEGGCSSQKIVLFVFIS